METELMRNEINNQEKWESVAATPQNSARFQTAQTAKSDAERRTSSLAHLFVHGDGRRSNPDRRQNSIPVAIDRRSGMSRRNSGDRRSNRD